MAFEQGFQQPGAHFGSDGDLSLKQKWNSISGADTASENANGCFDCNICLDSAHEPVVTLCGHLYCWPCIYKWLQVQSSSPDSDQEQPKCPVCKADISRSTVVPLYGRGSSPSDSEGKKPHLGMVIPRRPPPSGLNALITSTATSTLHPSQQLLHPNFFQSPTQSFHHQQYFPHPYGGYPATAPSTVGGIAATSVFNPTVMFGEMFLARMFGSSDTSMFTHPYPASYPPTATGSPRMRRQEMQLDKSLNRVSIFLFCCFILCLLLF